MERFVDEAEIHIQAGKGGDGCVSFRREKYVPRGGPNGGDGGKGGDVIFLADTQTETLLDFKFRPRYKAENGRPGEGQDKFGRYGEDLIVKVPVGTVIRERETDILLKDLSEPGQQVVLTKGGAGGRGNKHFASSTHQTPREFEKGEEGEDRWLKLELKLVADVGLIGLPNAGKSTFLSRVSSATPKIADYPFTTLRPHLGLIALNEDVRFVMADLPGLIEGAHEGVGLGDRFLRHIERTRILLFILDTSGFSGTEPAEAYHSLRHEISSYNPAMLDRPCLVAANKMDVTESAEWLELLEEELDVPIFPISAVTGQGIRPLLNELAKILGEIKATFLH